MIALLLLIVLFIFFLFAIAVAMLYREAWRNWGAAREELEQKYPADEQIKFPDMKAHRAITIKAPAAHVWPWIAQIGRGAGWYSYDMLDNWGHKSADYIMDIPPPVKGDKSAIGSIVHLKKGKSLVWLSKDVRWIGCEWDICFDYELRPQGEFATRVFMVVRAKGHQEGVLAEFAMFVNDMIESLMGVKQLKTLKRMVETYRERLNSGKIVKSNDPKVHQRYGFTYGEPAEEEEEETKEETRQIPVFDAVPKIMSKTPERETKKEAEEEDDGSDNNPMDELPW